jgi:hypothetical protein
VPDPLHDRHNFRKVVVSGLPGGHNFREVVTIVETMILEYP